MVALKNQKSSIKLQNQVLNKKERSKALQKLLYDRSDIVKNLRKAQNHLSQNSEHNQTLNFSLNSKPKKKKNLNRTVKFEDQPSLDLKHKNYEK
jgi:hypothetical protein